MATDPRVPAAPATNGITPAQVEASFRTAGLAPLAPPDVLAAALSSQLQAAAPALGGNAFWVDASAFGAALAREAQ